MNSQKGEKDLGISPDIVTKVLQELDKFEKKQEFLKTNLTTALVAQKLKTNAKYLSKIINYHKQKSFTQYINELRIDFIVEALKTNTRYRQYTIKALASEAGFNSTEVFSKSFYKKTGIYPSYFIKQLEKQAYDKVWFPVLGVLILRIKSSIVFFSWFIVVSLACNHIKI